VDVCTTIPESTLDIIKVSYRVKLELFLKDKEMVGMDITTHI
jgi:hypothetical protein